jgi:hypothetical protein
MDDKAQIDMAKNHAEYLVERFGYTWKSAVEASAAKHGVSTEGIYRHFEFLKKEREKVYASAVQKAADHARDLAIYENYNWGLAIKIAADEYDVNSGDISREFAARRAERAEKKKAAKAW